MPYCLSAHAQERLLYHLKITIKKNYFHLNCQANNTGKKSTMADLYTTPSRTISFRPSWQFLEALLLRNAGQPQMLIGKHSEYFSLRKGVVPGWISLL